MRATNLFSSFCHANMEVDIILMVFTGYIVSEPSPFFFYDLQDGRTPLHICCIKGKVEIVRLLIEHGANATAKDNVCDTYIDI